MTKVSRVQTEMDVPKKPQADLQTINTFVTLNMKFIKFVLQLRGMMYKTARYQAHPPYQQILIQQLLKRVGR